MRAEINDFSGGITDYIFNNDITTYELADNLSITKDKGLETRWGSNVMDVTDSRPIVSSTIPSAMYDYQDYKIIIHGGQILAFKDGIWTEIHGVNILNKPLTQAGNGVSISAYEWNKHLVITDNAGSKEIKLFIDNANNFKVVTAGLPRIASLPTVTPSANNGKNYIYSYHYFYEYYAQDVKHVDYGPVIEHLISNASATSNVITNIPVLANNNFTHYDLANIKVKIYRTVDSGTEGYLVGTIANGVTTFTDTVNDDDLQLNELLYISAGASDNDEPPIAKFIDVTNNCGWYANLKDYPYRALQSQPSDFDSVPASYYVDFEEEIVGWSSYQSNPIAFTENQIWRVEGTVDINGGGEHRKVMVADGESCLSNSSIVKTDKGLFYAGLTSFMWTDGYTTKKVPSDEKNIPERYAMFAGNKANIKASYNRYTNRIYWTVKSSTTDFAIYVYDITFNALVGPWTGRPDSFRPSAILCSKDKKIYRADESGYILVHQPELYEDPIIEVGKAPSTWQRYPVRYNFKNIAYDFAASDTNKWVTKATISGEGKTNLDVAILSYDDTSINPKELTPLKHSSGLVWGDENWIWGDVADVWGLEVRLNQTRHFRSGKLRCKRKQIAMTNAIVPIAKSLDDVPTSMATVDATAKTITVLDTSSVFIPTNSIGMDMVINGLKYEIIDSGADTFKVSDPAGSLVSGTTHWAIEGYPHNQRFHLSSIIYTYETMDDKGGYYQKGVVINAN